MRKSSFPTERELQGKKFKKSGNGEIKTDLYAFKF